MWWKAANFRPNLFDGIIFITGSNCTEELRLVTTDMFANGNASLPPFFHIMKDEDTARLTHVGRVTVSLIRKCVGIACSRE